MDPVSLAASIIALAELTGKVLGYLHSVKNASKERKSFIQEATSALGLLNGLHFRVENAEPESNWFVAVRGLASPGGPLEQYREALELLQERLSPSISLHRVGKALEWHFSKPEVQRIFQTIERLKSLTQIALEQDHFELSQAIRQQMLSIGREASAIKENTTAIRQSTAILVDNVRQVEEAVKDINTDTTRVAEHVSLQQLQAMAEWFSVDDYTKQQHDLIQRRQSETGLWFLNSNELKQWKEGTPCTLYCPGDPGTGKTIMAATVIDHLRRTVHSANTPVVYLYFNYKRRAEQTSVHFLRTILRQLLVSCALVPQSVKQFYDHNVRKGTQPSEEEIIMLLETFMATFTRVFLIVDALDECATYDRAKLLSTISVVQRKCTLGLLATSRKLPEVQLAVHPDLILQIRASTGDVETFVRGHMGELSRCVRKSIDMQNHVVAAIAAAVDGMFLLAQLHLDTLRDKRSEKAVKKALEKLPSGSDAYDIAYENAMERILTQAKGDADLATATISWVLRSKRPLSSLELQHALAIEPNSPAPDPTNLVEPDELLSVCGGLVIADRETDIVRLVHYTMQEYLERHQTRWLPLANLYLATACVSYMSYDFFASDESSDLANFGFARRTLGSRHGWARRPSETTREAQRTRKSWDSKVRHYPLVRYAANHWGHHLRDVEKSDSLDPDLKSWALCFLRNKKLVQSCAIALSRSADIPWAERGMYGAGALHICAFFDLKFGTEQLLADGVDRNITTLSNNAPLAIASYFGSEQAVNLLLNYERNSKKMSIDVPDNWGNTPLLSAVQKGRVTISKMLLEAGANAGHLSVAGFQPLTIAAIEGHTEIVKLLLKIDTIDVDYAGSGHRTPLSYAAHHGHVEVVKLLLDTNKVNVNHQDFRGWTPLFHAAKRGHIDVVKLLQGTATLDKTVVNDVDRRTALSVAAEYGHEAVVGSLLQISHEKVALKDLLGLTPFCYAAQGGHTGIMQLLSDTGKIDPNSKDNRGQTALHLAVSTSQAEAAHVLLRTSKVDVNAKDTHGSTPLHLAVQERRKRMIQILLHRPDVDVNLKDDKLGRTPLHYAALNSDEEIVRLLLDVGAGDVSLKDNEGLTPVGVAVKEGRADIAEILEMRSKQSEKLRRQRLSEAFEREKAPQTHLRGKSA